MEALFLSWVNSTQTFNISDKVSYTYGQLYTDVINAREKVSTKFSKKQLIVLEAANDYKTYVKFLALLLERHCVFMSASYQFNDIAFRDLLKSELNSSPLYLASEKDFSDLKDLGEINSSLLNDVLLREDTHPFIVRTSGTSGNKFKFICHDASNFILKYKTIGNHFHTTISFSPADTIAGIETLLEVITHHNTLVSDSDKMTPAKIADYIESFKVDYFQTTPSFLNLMLVAKVFNSEKMKSLVKIAYGSEPSLTSSLLAIKKEVPQITFKHTYGMSEIGILNTITDQDDPSRFYFDEKINQSKIENDLLFIKAPTQMLGYFNYPNDNSEWFKTGDVAKKSADGYIKILGRADDLINMAGRKFYPYEVEDLLIRAEDALDVSVSTQKNDLIGNIIIAKFFLDESIDESFFRERLKKHCEEHVPYFMCPHKVYITREPFITSRFKKERKV